MFGVYITNSQYPGNQGDFRCLVLPEQQSNVHLYSTDYNAISRKSHKMYIQETVSIIFLAFLGKYIH